MSASAFLAAERQVAIDAVRRACHVCNAVFSKLVTAETVTKKDNSPVTVADLAAQAVVNSVLMKAFPDDPVVGEEDSGFLRSPEGAEMRERVRQLVNDVVQTPLTMEQILDSIDNGKFAGGPKGRHWTLDPIDGTKGFLRGEQFAVCLALIVDGVIRLGVMGCPNLPKNAKSPEDGKGCIFIAVENQGAFQRDIDDDAEHKISTSDVKEVPLANFCESVEAAHSSHSDSAKISSLLGITIPPIRMDSQCKYATIARGDASIYMRLPTRKDYEENIWDHASGWLLVREAGGHVVDCRGSPLDFSIGRTLKANVGVIATNAFLLDPVLKAVGDVLKEGGHL